MQERMGTCASRLMCSLYRKFRWSLAGFLIVWPRYLAILRTSGNRKSAPACARVSEAALCTCSHLQRTPASA